MRTLESAGLNHGSSGNASVRLEAGMLITPSGVPAPALDADAMVPLALDGSTPPGGLRPSSEWRLHAAVYAARGDLAAVVHAHPPYATALACARRPIPAFHYMVAVGGANHIPCAGYATFGTAALAEEVVAALGAQGRACLMANHGLLAAGADLDAAVRLAREVEYLARLYALSLQVGEPVILDEAEMARVVERLRDYRPR